jgi:hypothetical protein
VELKGGDQSINHRAGTEGAGSIVDQHRIRRKGLQARIDGICALGAADHEVGDREAFQGLCRQILLTLANHHADVPNRRMFQEGLDGPSKYGLPSENSELLGQSATEAFALPGGDNQCSYRHGARLAPVRRLL